MSDPVCSTEERIITLDFDWNLESDLKDSRGPLFLARIVKRSLQRVTHKLLSKLEGLANHVHFVRGLASPAVRVQLGISDLSSISFVSMRVGDMEPFADELACWVRLCTDQAGNKQAKACNEPVLYIHIYIYLYTRSDNPTKKQQCLVEQDILFFGGVPCGPLPGAWTFKLRDHGMQIRTAESYLVRRGPGRAWRLARRLWR